MAYEPRLYRQWPETPGLVSFDVRLRETDLRIRAERDLRGQAAGLVRRFRADIERYAQDRAEFISSFTPLPIPARCPDIVRAMLDAAREYDVGPMAAVAGAVAEAVGRELLAFSANCIVENGGDVFVKLDRPVKLGLYAGEDSPFTGRLSLLVDSVERAVGVCASSGTVGHSFSSGRADAVVAVAPDAALADAAATAVCNSVQSPDDVQAVVEAERERGRLDALVVLMGERIGAYGRVELMT